MKNHELDPDKIQKLHSKINTPLTYKEICNISGFPYVLGNMKTSFLNKLSRWCKIEKTQSPTRFIIKEFYTEPLEFSPRVATLPNDEEKYQEAKEFFIKRKLTCLKPLAYPIRNRQEISYTCDFHPNITQTTSWKNLRASVGCPLCRYRFSRFEIMVYLGIKNAQSQVKFSGVEFDIYIPYLNTVVEVDGAFFHKDDTLEQIERKTKAANENNLNFLKIVEILDVNKIGIEGKTLYVTPFSSASASARKKIIANLSVFLPFIYTETLWDEAADYMRQTKTTEPIFPEVINQYDENNNLLNTFTPSQLFSELSKGSAFGYNWILG